MSKPSFAVKAFTRRLVPVSLALFAATALAVPQETEQPETSQVEGFTEPYADISMAAAEMGTLADVDVAEGDEVQTGQLLASLDVRVLKASLEVAKASMNSKGALKSAEADLSMKQKELQKLAELRVRNHASQQEVDRITSDVTVAEARLQSVKEDLEVKRLEYERILAQLQQREIRSTIAGTVVDVFKDRGEFVSPSDPVVIRVVQLDPLLVVYSVPAGERSKLRSGQKVPIRMDQSDSQALGIVEYVSPTADASSGTVRVKVRVPNPNLSWQSGTRTVLMLDQISSADTQTPQVARRVR
jgi:RND family efflux transporter MFP subunit